LLLENGQNRKGGRSRQGRISRSHLFVVGKKAGGRVYAPAFRPRTQRMSIKLRLALLIGLLLLLLLGSLVALRALERRQMTTEGAAARRDDAPRAATGIEQRALLLRRFAEDAAKWWVVAGVEAEPGASAVWAREVLEPVLADYTVEVLWLADADGGVWHRVQPMGSPELALPVSPTRSGDPSSEEAGARVFFHPVAEGLLMVSGVRLGAAGGPWLFAARLWDGTLLAERGELSDGEAGSGPWRAASAHGEADRLRTRVFLVFGLGLIAAVAVSLHRWVLRPLGWITESLSRHDTAPIQRLLVERNELTRVARLIVTSFEHREHLRREVAERRRAEAELHRTLEERARLGRDLHDGLIQSLYAAGMGLAAARRRVVDEPAAADQHLAQVASVLNDAIREVRDFITGLEPEPAEQGAFTPKVERLFATINTGGDARVELALDEELAARLPTRLRTELLLLMREAFSNALRHGRAGVLRVSLKADPLHPQVARLSVGDDGIGFDPATARRGRGLDNLFARAATHGGRAGIDSRPEGGTRIEFEFPLPMPEDEDDETEAEAPAPEAPAPKK
jgi:signal transduction histidine kinase